MKKITLLTSALLVSIAAMAQSSLADTQTLWAKFIKNSVDEQSLTSQGGQMVLAQDGGLYVVGQVGSTTSEQDIVLTDGTNPVTLASGINYGGNSSNQGLLFMKLDAQGNVVWKVAQTQGEINSNEDHVAATPDGGAVLLVNARHTDGFLGENIAFLDAKGVTHEIDWTVENDRNFRGMVIKVDAEGGIEWMKQIIANTYADVETYPAWSQSSRNIGQGLKTYALEVDNEGNIYVGGIMCAAITVDDVTIEPHNVNTWTGNSSTFGNMYIIKLNQDGDYVKHLVSEGAATQENVQCLKVVGNKLYMFAWIAGLAGTEFSIGGEAVTPATVNGSIALAQLDTDLNVDWLKFHESTISGTAWQMPTLNVAGDYIYVMGTAKYGININGTAIENPSNKARQSWIIQFDSNGEAVAAQKLATGKMQMQHGFFGGYEGTDGSFYAVERGLTPSSSFGSELILYKFNLNGLEIEDQVQLALGSCDGQSVITDGTKLYIMSRFANKNETISFYNYDQTFTSASFVWGQSAFEVPVGAVQSITIDGEAEINLEKGKSLELVATMLPEGAANANIIWSSSNEGAVTVDENGKITAVNTQKSGSDFAIITATSAGSPSVKASVKVNASNVTAISTIEGSKTVKSVRYYNVAGMESETPFKGMNIVVKTYTDGSRTTEKIVR